MRMGSLKDRGHKPEGEKKNQKGEYIVFMIPKQTLKF